jgi:hypothetical protein
MGNVFLEAIESIPFYFDHRNLGCLEIKVQKPQDPIKKSLTGTF